MHCGEVCCPVSRGYCVPSCTSGDVVLKQQKVLQAAFWSLVPCGRHAAPLTMLHLTSQKVAAAGWGPFGGCCCCWRLCLFCPIWRPCLAHLPCPTRPTMPKPNRTTASTDLAGQSWPEFECVVNLRMQNYKSRRAWASIALRCTDCQQWAMPIGIAMMPLGTINHPTY